MTRKLLPEHSRSEGIGAIKMPASLFTNSQLNPCHVSPLPGKPDSVVRTIVVFGSAFCSSSLRS